MNRASRRASGLVRVMSERGPVLIERDALRISERIREYDENLKIQYLEDPDAPGEPPFRLVEHCRDGIDRVVFTFWELDERILQRIYRADTVRHDIDKRLTTANAKAKMRQRQRYQDQKDEAADIAVHVLKSPKNRYTYKNEDGKKITFE